MFTVMGITGKVGGAVAENLLAAGKTVRGVVRDSQGCSSPQAFCSPSTGWVTLRIIC
jgi:uncharacterized protein YbjT (DUF2867 family)